VAAAKGEGRPFLVTTGSSLILDPGEQEELRESNLQKLGLGKEADFGWVKDFRRIGYAFWIQSSFVDRHFNGLDASLVGGTSGNRVRRGGDPRV
jgi:hypothetical protein